MSYIKVVRSFIFLLALTSMSGLGYTKEILVIVHPDNPVASLTNRNVLDIYTGKLVAFPNGKTALPVDLADEENVKASFYQSLTGKTLAQMSSYWAKLLFTGRYSPPLQLDTPSHVIEYVSENQFAIAYIDASWLTEKVKVVYRLKANES